LRIIKHLFKRNKVMWHICISFNKNNTEKIKRIRYCPNKFRSRGLSH